MSTLAQLRSDFERRLNAAASIRDLAKAEVQTILDRAKRAGRTHLTAEEDALCADAFTRGQAADAEVTKLTDQLADLRKIQDQEDQNDIGLATPGAPVRGGSTADVSRHADGGRWLRASDRVTANVERGQRFADHPVVAGRIQARAAADQHVIGQHGSLGGLVRAMSTTTGSALVPTMWASDIIDRARNASRVIQAGAEIVPMDTKIVQIGRLTVDPTAAFRAEGSTITASDPTFDNVTLTATTLSALVVGSVEWFQDAPNVDDVVSEAVGAAMAAELDLNALMGGVIAGGEVGATGYNRTFASPPSPRGVLATLLAVASSNVLGSGANGTAQTPATFWREVQQTVFQPQSFNESPNGLIWNAKLYQQYIDAYDTTNQPLRMPENIAALPQYVTNQIESFTQGTMTNVATDLFVGDWTKLLIGQRLDFTVQTLTERYAELGQIGILVTWRGDVQLARPRAFACYRYLQGAV